MGNRAVNHGWVTCKRGSNRHFFDATGKLSQQCTFRRERAHMDRMEASPVYHDRHFHTGAFGQVRDELRIADIAIELEHLTALERVDDVRRVFMTALQILLCKGLSESFF